MVGGHVREEIQLKYQRTTETVVMVTESVHVMSIDSCVFEDGVDNSGGSRGGSIGSMESLFWRAAFENTMPKRTTYTILLYYTMHIVPLYANALWVVQYKTLTTLTLERRTSASTVAITQVCQLLYQEFDARMAYVHVYTTTSTWQP